MDLTEKSKVKQISRYDVVSGLQYSLIIFVFTFLFEISTKSDLSWAIIAISLKNSIIAWSGILVKKYYTDYTK